MYKLTGYYNFVSFLQLKLYARYPGKTELTLHSGFEASVVAVEKIKDEYSMTNEVELFTSLAIIIPLFVLLLIWFYVYGARAYVRRHINNAENYPTIAALYWIGQSFTVFVITMDVLALYHNFALTTENEAAGNTNPQRAHQVLRSYQFIIIILIIVFEILSLTLSVFLTLISVCSYLNVLCKIYIKWLFKHMYYGIFFNEPVKRREVRLWLCCSGFIPPVISFSSHIGFIVGGWISYGERSTAIVLYYLFIFIFLYWSLQHVYILFVKKSISVTKKQISKNDPTQVLFQYCSMNENEDPEVQFLPHAETPDTEWSIHDTNIKREGFNAMALFLMIFIVIVLDGLIAYIGAGILYLPLLESIDELFIRIYVIGEYTFAIGVFVISYRLLSGKAGWGNHGSVSNDTLKFWTFLNSTTDNVSSDCHNQHLPILHHTMNSLLLTVQACGSKKAISNKRLMEAKKRFNKIDREIPRVNKCDVLEDLFRHCLKYIVACLCWGVHVENKIDSGVVPIFHMEDKFIVANNMLDLAEIYAKYIKKPYRREALKALEPLCKGIKHLQETLLYELDIPPMHFNRDKANALAAAVVFQKVNTPQRFSSRSIKTEVSFFVPFSHSIKPIMAFQVNFRRLLLSSRGYTRSLMLLSECFRVALLYTVRFLVCSQ